MAVDIPDWFIKQYEADVFVAYQRTMSMLAPYVRKGTVVGQTVNVPKYGTGEAGQKDRHGYVPVMNVDHGTVEFNVEDWYAGEWVDKLDLLKTNRDERANAANAGAYALARKKDKLIITALRASLGSGQKITDAGGMTYAKLMKGFELLDGADVPDDGDRVCTLGPHQWSELSKLEQFSSVDWVNSKTAEGGRYQTRRWNGCTFINTQSLLTEFKASAIRPCLMFHKSAIAWGDGADVSADITWHGDRAAWFINHMMSGGAKRIEDLGVVEISADDTSTIS